MSNQQADLETIKVDFSAFIQGAHSCTLATTSPEGGPEASYAPCIHHQGNFYIFVSELASHTRNLLDRPQASLLLTENQPRNLFACKRATLEITAQPIERDTPRWLAVLSEMETRLGNTVSVIRGLNDFHLLELQPQKASYVTGFGKAYELQGEQLQKISHINRTR
ncbi:HugZ family protein [Marinospirillum sp.]|uniref:HugZ family pyridoxamine 5'-phosphate oxidase n=1 Tax=Marinospirillum sp. TaxID=2183934 RepID=UPI003850BC6A